jgi:hypothetical protein
MAKIYLARKATLGYSLTCSFHQSKDDPASLHINEKDTVKSQPSFAFAPKIGVSKGESDGPFVVEVQVLATSRFKKWLHFTSQGIKILLSYFVVRSLALSWPRKSMTHFSPLNFRSNIRANIL